MREKSCTTEAAAAEARAKSHASMETYSWTTEPRSAPKSNTTVETPATMEAAAMKASTTTVESAAHTTASATLRRERRDGQRQKQQHYNCPQHNHSLLPFRSTLGVGEAKWNRQECLCHMSGREVLLTPSGGRCPSAPGTYLSCLYSWFRRLHRIRRTGFGTVPRWHKSLREAEWCSRFRA